jgi:hypothetical protein
MKNPLHASQPQPARAIPKPSPDDFFAEMGVSSTPKKLPAAPAQTTTTTTSLGATKLPVDDAEVDANWADDADLDDLLDD